jgi:hypothetical protein
MARHAAVDLAHVLGGGVTRSADRLSPEGLASVRADLARAGLRLNHSRAADEALADLRRSYEPYLAALSSRLQMPCPGWRRASPDSDNWQTNPAEEGGPHF